MISIPEIRHRSLQYGSHWSNQRGQSGHYIRSNCKQEYVKAQERPDLSWGTEAQSMADRWGTTVTLSEIREAIAEEQEQ